MPASRIGGNSSAATTSVTSVSVAVPTVADGDIGLLVHGYNGSLGASTAPAGWTLETTLNVTSSATLVLYRKTLTAAESGSTLTITNATAQRLGAVLEVYRGASFSSVLSFAQTTGSTTHTNPSGTAPVGGAVTASFWFERSSTPSTSVTQPAGDVLRNASFGTGSGAVSVAASDDLTTIASGGSIGGGNWSSSGANPNIGTLLVVMVPAAADPLAVELAVVPTSGVVPFTVTATATTAGGSGGTKAYTFTWGDGDVTGPQTSNTATHEFDTAGSYNVTVSVTEA